jgi:hypothetical protein
MRLRPPRPPRRDRSRERGFALAIAIILAVLYFGLIELLLVDSARELDQARRFRARVMAMTLAENGAEIAAFQMITSPPASTPPYEDWQGTATGELSRPEPSIFRLKGTGETKGLVKSKATVQVIGHIDNGIRVYIDYTMHTP